MNKLSMLVITLSFIVGVISPGNAVPLRISVPGIVFTAKQPIQVIIVDSNGNATEQTLYYDPSVEGIDLDTGWAGPNASVYFPSLDTGYIWFNGFWVDQDGYYWDRGRRVYLDSPRWKEHWSGYWRTHKHEGRSRWDRKDWHEREHKEWRHENEQKDDRREKEQRHERNHEKSEHHDQKGTVNEVKK